MSERPAQRIWTLAAVFVVTAGAVGIAGADGPVVGPDATFEAGNSGPAVTIAEQLELDDSLNYPDGQTITLPGHATFSSSGATAVTVENIGGDWTNLTTTDVSPGLTVDPADKQSVTVESTDMATFNFSSVDAENDDDPDLVYDASQSVTVTVTDLPADTDIEAVDTATGTELTSGTTDGTGAVTLTFDAGERAVALAEPSGGGGGGGGSSDDTPTPTATPTPSATPTATETRTESSSVSVDRTETPTVTETQSGDGGQSGVRTTAAPTEATTTSSASVPGFGPAVALVGLLVTVGVLARWRG